MACALLVAHENMLNVFLLENLVIDREDGASRIAKNMVNTLILQSLNNHFSACHLPGHVSIP